MDKTLFIATTNVSAHYDDAEAFEQGRRFLELVQAGDGAQLLQFAQQGHITACGASAVAAFIIPTGYFERFGGTKEIDLASRLDSPYTDDELGEALKSAMEKCYSMKPDDSLNETVIERFLNIKGYSKAVKGRKLVGFEWEVEAGYSIIPTEKIPKRGYVHLKEKTFLLGKQLETTELGKAARQAVELSKA